MVLDDNLQESLGLAAVEGLILEPTPSTTYSVYASIVRKYMRLTMFFSSSAHFFLVTVFHFLLHKYSPMKGRISPATK